LNRECKSWTWLTGEHGRVFAFEPEPNLFASLCKNCSLNQVANIRPYQCAAGAANGRATFQRASFNSGDNRLGEGKALKQQIEVEVARLDDLLPEREIQFIKLDVQGHELAALTGMERVLASSPQVRILFEFWPTGLRAANASPETLLGFFRDRDFRVYEMEGEDSHLLEAPAHLVAKLGANGYTNLLASRTPLVRP